MKPDFNKDKGLIPVIIQDAISLQVLMLGYMNETAYLQTLSEKKVTFFSRSKNRLWTKGESSGNYLWVQAMELDCDQDTLIILAKADGPTCHTGAVSCFGTPSSSNYLYRLENTIEQRIEQKVAGSYTHLLFSKGINKVAQKVGEEAVELVIEAMDNDSERFKNEAADLLYHFLLLLKAKGHSLKEIEQVLASREKG